MSFNISLTNYMKRLQEVYMPLASRALLSRDEFMLPAVWSASAVLHQLDLSVSSEGHLLQEQLEVLIVYRHFAFVKYAGAEDWVNVSNHDSCWITGIESAADNVQQRLGHQLITQHPELLMRTFEYKGWPWSPKQKVVHYLPDEERNKRHGSTYWLKIDVVKDCG